jgi:hypothetical protein
MATGNAMNDPIREAFETITYSTLNIAGTRTGHGLRRKLNGEYVSDLLEDHWNTFQEGWECAVEHLKQRNNTQYSDIVSDGGMDPR